VPASYSRTLLVVASTACQLQPPCQLATFLDAWTPREVPAINRFAEELESPILDRALRGTNL